MILLKKTTMQAAICLALCTVTTLHAQERMRAGNWENTVIAASGQTMTNACISAHDAAMSNGSPAVIRAEVEKALAKSGACKLTDFDIDSTARPRR